MPIAKTGVRCLRSVKANEPAWMKSTTKPQAKPKAPRICHPGGIIKTNKQEAMKRFMERKRRKNPNHQLSERELKLANLSKESRRADTVFVTTADLINKEKGDLRDVLNGKLRKKGTLKRKHSSQKGYKKNKNKKTVYGNGKKGKSKNKSRNKSAKNGHLGSTVDYLSPGWKLVGRGKRRKVKTTKNKVSLEERLSGQLVTTR